MLLEMLERDVFKIQSWCKMWGMRLNPSKSKSFVIVRSRTRDPPHPDLIIDGETMKNCSSIKLLGVTFDSKLSFEDNLCSVISSISQKVGLLRKCRHVFLC